MSPCAPMAMALSTGETVWEYSQYTLDPAHSMGLKMGELVSLSSQPCCCWLRRAIMSPTFPGSFIVEGSRPCCVQYCCNAAWPFLGTLSAFMLPSSMELDSVCRSRGVTTFGILGSRV